MKTIMILVIIPISISLVGCSEPQRASINEIRFGMAIFELQEIHKEPLILMGIERLEDYELNQYRIWLHDEPHNESPVSAFRRGYYGTNKTPYVITFEVYPPITNEQLEDDMLNYKGGWPLNPEIAGKIISNQTGQNYSRLIKIVVDEVALMQRDLSVQQRNYNAKQQHYNQMQQLQDFQNQSQEKYNQMIEWPNQQQGR